MLDPYVLGVLDFFVIGGVTGLLLYYFVFRKTSKEVPSFKKLTVGYCKLVCFANQVMFMYTWLYCRSVIVEVQYVLNCYTPFLWYANLSFNEMN